MKGGSAYRAAEQIALTARERDRTDRFCGRGAIGTVKPNGAVTHRDRHGVRNAVGEVPSIVVVEVEPDAREIDLPDFVDTGGIEQATRAADIEDEHRAKLTRNRR